MGLIDPSPLMKLKRNSEIYSLDDHPAFEVQFLKSRSVNK